MSPSPHPLGRWTGVSLISILVGLSAVVLFVVGLVMLQAVRLGVGAACLSASFAAISTGWALDFKLAPTAVTGAQRLRIRGMQVLFSATAAGCVIIGFVRL